MKKKLLAFLMLLLSSATVSWAVPQYITYQGTLKQKGIPVTGPLTMQFTFVNADGSAIPNVLPISTNVVVTNGLFAVQLALPTLPANLDWSNLTPAIQVSIGSQQLSPPQVISSNLYAIVSQTVVDGAITQEKLASEVQNAFTPTGSVIAFAGPTAPTGWLLCDGSAVSRATYTNLFKIIGTVWGAGDGTTTFNLPDLRGRAPIGAGQGVGLTNRSLADTTGAETHTLLLTEMPSHSHTINDSGHQHEAAVGSNGPFGSGPVRSPIIGGTGLYTTNTTLTSSVKTGITINSTGGDSAGNTVPHSIMQPSIVVNFIIKE